VKLLDVELLNKPGSAAPESRALRLALDSAKALNLVFGSVDVIEVAANAQSTIRDPQSGAARVLEVNSG